MIEKSYKFLPSELSSQSLSSDQAWYDREGLHQRDERGAGSTPAEVSQIVTIKKTMNMTIKMTTIRMIKMTTIIMIKMTLIMILIIIFKMSFPGSLMGR